MLVIHYKCTVYPRILMQAASESAVGKLSELTSGCKSSYTFARLCTSPFLPGAFHTLQRLKHVAMIVTCCFQSLDAPIDVAVHLFQTDRKLSAGLLPIVDEVARYAQIQMR